MLKKYYSVYIKDFINIKYSNSLSHIPKWTKLIIKKLILIKKLRIKAKNLKMWLKLLKIKMWIYLIIIVIKIN